jgi:hypothetical protein
MRSRHAEPSCGYLHRVRRIAMVLRMDRAPLVEIHGTRRGSPLATPVRELPLRLPVIA